MSSPSLKSLTIDSVSLSTHTKVKRIHKKEVSRYKCWKQSQRVQEWGSSNANDLLPLEQAVLHVLWKWANMSGVTSVCLSFVWKSSTLGNVARFH